MEATWIPMLAAVLIATVSSAVGQTIYGKSFPYETRIRSPMSAVGYPSNTLTTYQLSQLQSYQQQLQQAQNAFQQQLNQQQYPNSYGGLGYNPYSSYSNMAGSQTPQYQYYNPGTATMQNHAVDV